VARDGGQPEAVLTDDVRTHVVVLFASCRGVDEVRAWLADAHPEIAAQLKPSTLSYYNGNNPGAYANLPARWKTLFDATRAAYFADASREPIAHKAHRLRLANDLVEDLLPNVVKRSPSGGSSVNLVIADQIQKLLEYAAREDGGMFTNRRILEHDARGNLAKLLGCDPSELPEKADDGAEP
jgi:hypothetical protein